MTPWIVIQQDIYLLPHFFSMPIPSGWRVNLDIPHQSSIKACRDEINRYADEYNLISAYITPRLHRRQVRRWLRRNRK